MLDLINHKVEEKGNKYKIYIYYNVNNIENQKDLHRIINDIY